jgi:L-ascorbate metabolism protein UlaG (beta-lactamase superfamily)
MRACLAVLLVTVSLAPAQAPAQKKTVTLHWYGQSFFSIESSKGTKVVIDPHAIEAYGRPMPKADLLLVSHFHNDHTQLGSVANPREAKIVYGLETDGKKTDWKLIDETVKDVKVRSVGTYHDAMQGLERGKNTIFIIEMDGLRIVHLGDLGHELTPEQVRRIGPVDVLMVPVGGIYTLNGAEAKKVVAQIKPKMYVIPMHCGTSVYEDVLPATEFLEDQKNVKRLPANKLAIETDLKTDTPIIAVLNWK